MWRPRYDASGVGKLFSAIIAEDRSVILRRGYLKAWSRDFRKSGHCAREKRASRRLLVAIGGALAGTWRYRFLRRGARLREQGDRGEPAAFAKKRRQLNPLSGTLAGYRLTHKLKLAIRDGSEHDMASPRASTPDQQTT